MTLYEAELELEKGKIVFDAGRFCQSENAHLSKPIKFYRKPKLSLMKLLMRFRRSLRCTIV